MRLGEEPYMDADRRNDILLMIAQSHAKEARVNEVRASIPAWADRPFKDDQDNFNINLKAYQTANPVVLKLEGRLESEPGPIWKELTPEERQALSDWTISLDNLEGYVNSYFPTETQKYMPQIILWGIAIGSFVAPLFLSEDDNGLSLPFHVGPPPIPPGMVPFRAPAASRPAVATQSQRPAFSPSAFSRIPGVSRPSGAIPLQAEIMRPAVSTPPWRPSVLTAPGSGAPTGAATPGYRAFAKPFGQTTTTPVTPASVQAVATGASPAAPPLNPHGPPIYPRFRRE